MNVPYEKFVNKFLHIYQITNYIKASNSTIISENKFYNFVLNDLKLMYTNNIVDEIKLVICLIYFKRFLHYGIIKDSYINIVVALNLGIKYWDDQCRDLVYYLNNIINYEMIILKSKIPLNISPDLYLQTYNYVKS
jgi:hypothetical protein